MFPRATLLVVIVAGAACATGHEGNRASKEDPLHLRQRNAVTQDPADDQPLIAEGGPLPQTAPQNNEEGKPKGKIGDKSGWSTGVSLKGGDPEVKVKYKVKF